MGISSARTRDHDCLSQYAGGPRDQTVSRLSVTGLGVTPPGTKEAAAAVRDKPYRIRALKCKLEEEKDRVDKEIDRQRLNDVRDVGFEPGGEGGGDVPLGMDLIGSPAGHLLGPHVTDPKTGSQEA